MTLTITFRFRSIPPAQPAPAQPALARPAPPQPGPAGAAAAACGGPGPGNRQAQRGPLASSPPLASLLPLAEPALLLLAEAAGVGFLGKTVLTAALRSAQRALAS